MVFFLLPLRTVLLILGLFFAGLSVCMGRQEAHDYHYFATHPVELQRVMKWCRADTRNAETHECKNALHVETYPNVVR